MLVAVPGDAGGGLLPPGFLFGVATAGFQVEGGFNGPGEPANNWVRWERSGRVEPSGVACDFWRQPEEALDRAASLGCDAFGLSVEWTRLEPEEGEFDDTALDRYAEIMAMATERGLAPVVTLYHFTHPWYLGEEFWLTPGSPDRFAAHVARVVPRLAPHCRRWVTVNEPNVVALTGWVNGACPPGRRGAVADAWAVADNLLTAHVLAYDVIHQAQPDAVVTTSTSASSFYDCDRLLDDLLCARSLGIARDELDEWVDERRALHDVAFPPRHLGELALRKLFAASSPFGVPSGGLIGSRLRSPSPRRVVDAVYASPDQCTLDAIGLGWGGLDWGGLDWGNLDRGGPVASHALRWSPARAMWDVPPNPDGLAAWCRDQHVLTPEQPLWVVGDGIDGIASRADGGRAYPRLEGWDHSRYLQAHLGAVVDAVEGGAPVTAYLHRSLVDDYEWGSSYRRLIAGLRAGDRSVLQTG